MMFEEGDEMDDHAYAMWDAAYVLGALSADERREFEAHLATCSPCRAAVAELCGVPALLGQLKREDVTAIDSAVTTQPPAGLLPSLLDTVRRRRRRARVATWAAAAVAAAVLGIGVLVGVQGSLFGGAPQNVAVSVQPMAQVGTELLTSTVSLSSQRWGTAINLQCYCLAPTDAHHDTLAMVVVGRDGSQTRLATWVAEPGHTATPAGSTSTPMDQIASVQVVSADNGRVLLERAF